MNQLTITRENYEYLPLEYRDRVQRYFEKQTSQYGPAHKVKLCLTDEQYSTYLHNLHYARQYISHREMSMHSSSQRYSSDDMYRHMGLHASSPAMDTYNRWNSIEETPPKKDSPKLEEAILVKVQKEVKININIIEL